MKKAIIFSFMLVLALGLFSCNGKKSKGAGNEKKETKELWFFDTTKEATKLWFFDTTKEATEESTEETTSQKAPEKDLDYIDLGLPSGTLWKNANEGGDDALYTYEEAVSMFVDKLPTKEQLDELYNECTWTWKGNGYKVTGPNGESITLPATGARLCDGVVYLVGTHGSYWSSTPRDSDNAWGLRFYSGEVRMSRYNRCFGQSVRLVQ